MNPKQMTTLERLKELRRLQKNVGNAHNELYEFVSKMFGAKWSGGVNCTLEQSDRLEKQLVAKFGEEQFDKLIKEPEDESK